MKQRRAIAGILALGVLWASRSVVLAADAVPVPAAAEPVKFSLDQIDQMVAPVALYPDALLMQILIASTYPLEVVEADRWRRRNASLKDDALDKALEKEDWDPSVEGLTHFPDLLKRMSDNLDWTKDLGDAFLDQKDDVFNAVQTMRRKAQEAGNLQTTKEQVITKEVVNNKETIVIQQASPEVVYVPTYPPTVYGPTYAAPAYYPTAYGYTGGQMATASLLSFGLGVGVGALISDGCDWGGNDVHVNNNYYGGGGGGGKNNYNSNNNVNVNVDKTKINNRQKWEHNPEHRRNVDYRDKRTQDRFDKQDPAMARDRQQRDQARGYDRGQGGDRRGSGGAGDGRGQGDRGGLSQGGGGRPAGGGGQGGGNRGNAAGGKPTGAGKPGQATGDRGGASPQTRPASGGRQDAFSGYGNGNKTRQASERGAQSRGGQSWAGGGGGGAQRASGGGQRGGGGGGGGGHRGGGGGGRGGGGRGR